MNVKPVDKSKKSNIKCEHCKYWGWKLPDGTRVFVCNNIRSIRFNKVTQYWNRCKSFEWKD